MREVELRGQGAKAWRFLVMHHHLLSASPDEKLQRNGEMTRPVSVTMNGGQLVNICARHQIDAVLRGHQHLPFVGASMRVLESSRDQSRRFEPKMHRVLELAAGSAGANSSMMDPLMGENSFNYYEFSETGLSVTVYRYNESFSVEPLPSTPFSVPRLPSSD